MAEPLTLELTPTGGAFAQAVATGAAREIAVFGARGDRKTWSLLTATIMHAQQHAEAGFPLPVNWLGVSDYFASHKAKTHKTLLQPRWQGAWRLADGGHLARCIVGGSLLVEIRLTGIEDQGAIDRVRSETHCVWFEEVAPAASLVTSAGINEASWGMAISSMRLPTHAHVAAITTNYPDADHWSWSRFVTKDRPGDEDLDTLYFRIPAGEAASPADRAEWERALQSRPDLLSRLVRGEPGQLMLGDPVTPSFRESVHVRAQRVPIATGTIWCSWDAWHSPAVVVASLSSLGQLRIHYAKALHNADVGQLAEEAVIPFLTTAGLLGRPVVHTGDPTAETADQSNRDQSAASAIRERIPGQWRTVTNDWEPRRRTIGDHLRRVLSTGEPAIVVSGPDCRELTAALSGGWHYGKTGKPVNSGEEGKHSHVGNAMAYLCLAVYGAAGQGADMALYANQSAYTQEWGGAPPGQRSPSPALVAMAGRPINKAAWRRQYEGEE